MVPELLVLALDFHRAPLRYPQLTDPRIPLPEAFDRLFVDFAAAMTPQGLERLSRQLAERPGTIEAAARFFLRQALVMPGADHYRVLGLSRGASEGMVRIHYRLLIRLFHPDRADTDPADDAALSVRITDAYNALRHSASRAKYDLQLVDSSAVDAHRMDIATLLSPRCDLVLVGEAPTASRASHRWSRRIAYWLIASVGLLTLISILLSRDATRPGLRSNPDTAHASDPKPSYIRGQSAVPGTPPSESAVGITGSQAMADRTPAPPPSQRRAEAAFYLADGRSSDVASAARETAAGPPDSGRLRPLGSRVDGAATSTVGHESVEDPHVDRTTSNRSRGEARPPMGDVPRPDEATGRLEPGLDGATQGRWHARSPVSADEANALVVRFARAYGDGDLGALIGLFSADAVVDGGGFTSAREGYAALFSQAGARSMTLSRMSWQRLDAETAVGSARVALTTHRPGRSRAASRRFIGSIELELIRSDQGLKIKKLMHRLAQE